MCLGLDAVHDAAPDPQHKVCTELHLSPVVAVGTVMVGLQVCESLSLCYQQSMLCCPERCWQKTLQI